MLSKRVSFLLTMSFAVSGCGQVGGSAQDYAQSACTAYQKTGRVQVATTGDQLAAMVDLARSNARAAAAFDDRWSALYSDIHAAVDAMDSTQETDDGDRFFEIDKRVEDECRDAGRDIGKLEP